MTESLMERLRDIYENDDHDRGCQGRCYTCSCGFDERTFETAKAAEARIAELETEVARLREALSAIGDAGYVQPKDAPLLHNEAVDIARRALTTGDKP